MATEVPGSVVSGQNFLDFQFTYSPLLHFYFLGFFLSGNPFGLSLYLHHVLIIPYSFVKLLCVPPNLSTIVNPRHYRHPDGRRNRPNTLWASSAPILIAHKEEVDRLLLDYLCDWYLGSAIDSVLVSLVSHRSITQLGYVLRGGTDTPCSGCWLGCAVFSIVTASLGGVSVFEYFYRLHNLFRKKSSARPLNSRVSWVGFRPSIDLNH